MGGDRRVEPEGDRDDEEERRPGQEDPVRAQVEDQLLALVQQLPREGHGRNVRPSVASPAVNADVLLAGLDPAQRAAVTAEDNPLCILAGAGSGKTRVLTRRNAHRAASG
ncbi:MAG: UvrD-helicase domain-containing protein, partial [Acidimicrobiia bacterium]|nr:UvrD-helicase domain-containing protein [Acidimicrobiia bacterium]